MNTITLPATSLGIPILKSQVPNNARVPCYFPLLRLAQRCSAFPSPNQNNVMMHARNLGNLCVMLKLKR
jgi:hypothetical protein